MRIYCDITNESGCIGILPDPGTELILTGVELHTEPAKYRTLPLALRLAEECDVHVWFDDETPEKPFYTVPKTTLFAHDSRSGHFVSTEEPGLDWSVPLYYIDPMLVCHRIVPVGKELADMGKGWRETMVACSDIEIFPDRTAAERQYRILTLQQLLEAEV